MQRALALLRFQFLRNPPRPNLATGACHRRRVLAGKTRRVGSHKICYVTPHAARQAFYITGLGLIGGQSHDRPPISPGRRARSGAPPPSRSRSKVLSTELSLVKAPGRRTHVEWQGAAGHSRTRAVVRVGAAGTGVGLGESETPGCVKLPWRDRNRGRVMGRAPKAGNRNAAGDTAAIDAV